MGYPAPAYTGPPPKGGAGSKVALVLGGMGLAFVLMIVALVGAVTLRGKSSSSKFSSIGTAIPDVASPTKSTNSTNSTNSDWVLFTPPDSSFTIEFPGHPVVEPLPVATPQVERMFLAQTKTDSRSYSLNWFDLKPGFAFDREASLRNLAQGSASRSNSEMRNVVVEPFAGLPSISWDLELQGTDAHAHGFAMISGDRQYLFFVAAVGADSAEDFKRFRDSFHIN